MGKVDVPNWLANLPLAPTYYPTDTEFADPIAYISKIEKEASVFGICKVIPPLPKPSKKYVFSNLNHSLSKSPELDSSQLNHKKGTNGDLRAVFTTRHQELGCSAKKPKPQPHPPASLSHKQVWQSGEVYTLDQFESKARTFARTHLGTVNDVTPLAVEALFWKAASQKPIYIEYANDVPGSAFGVPDQVCHYFHRRRRRRPHINPRKNESGASDIDTDTLAFLNNDSNSPSRSTGQKSSNVVTDREGTAGWKLSNSPWNLQVISQSPGSLTRFMLNDIPGVTSPMVYIGMLFSWFAWHVEDHELHSLNFLHTGSPKTWYAVPGDYAFRFEEVIRSKGYGGDLDRLDALTLLGEKTNLLSPEVVIASGIPCCRLVQNPGEFVVTFPRAYHIGFSHGFNCGEAANFGTPQWLKVAKSAAVRRAAMNYLPMLSHQQLLYMLTMSFVARKPRDLHQGGRTSRLKDRQKEERELLVKKAFIDDIVNERNLLSVLHGKEATLHAVLWDPEALPSPASVSHETSTVSAMSIGRSTLDYQNNGGCNNQFDSTGLSIETLEDFYVDDNDLPCGLRVDSGILACVACGVLGFPFMTIVQPSQKASEELFPTDCQVTGGKEVLRAIDSHPLSDLYNVVVKSSSDVHYNDENQKASSTCRRNLRSMENCLQKSYTDAITTHSEATESVKQDTIWSRYASSVQLNCSIIPFGVGHPINSKGQLQSTSDSQRNWNTSNRFLRPRVFCLEHAIEIEKLLHSKGGANVLVICHSAYPKMKAQAVVIAEEISASFDCDEAPFQLASKEDTDLITISISNDEHEASGEDWTTRLGLNLPYCVKHRKLFPSKQEKHALALGGLFSDIFVGSDQLGIEWKSKRCRTPYKTVGLRQSKSCGRTQIEKSCVLLEKAVQINDDGESKIKQYSRRSCNQKAVSPLQACSEHSDYFKKYQPEDVRANNEALNSNINKDALCSGEMNEIFDSPRLAGLFSTNAENDVSKLVKSSGVKNSTQRESCSIAETKGITEISDIANCSGVLAIENIEKDCHELGGIPNAVSHNVCMAEETREPRAVSDYEIPVGSFAIPSSRVAIQEASLEGQNVDTLNERDKTCYIFTADCSKMQQMIIPADETSEMSNISNPIKSPSSQPNVITYSQIETKTLVEDESQNKDCNYEIQDILEVQAENQTMDATCEVRVFNHASLLTQPSLLSSTLENYREQEFPALEEANKDHEVCSSVEDTMVLEDTHSTVFDSQPTKKERSKRRRELGQLVEDEDSYNGFIKSPCEGLRPRTSREATRGSPDVITKVETASKIREQRLLNGSVSHRKNKMKVEEIYKCDIEGCQMSFKTREQMKMHKRNRCTYKGCGKQFSSHRYAVLHQRVHVDERPLKCHWKGCTMSFKWAWARTEHLRVHTRERPYHCKFEGCGLTFRFVSDFSRHRRKNGHNVES